MRILGIDPGSALLGYGIIDVEGDRVAAVAHGVLQTSTGTPMAERLRLLYDDLRSLIAHYRPDQAAVEELFFSRNVRTALPVGQARGVALLALAQAGIPVFEYTPLQVKQVMVGYGRARKGQVQAMLRILLSLATPPSPDDAADALAVALCHAQTVHLRQRLGSEDMV
jgi:crossover junction endodeoxyribonuclease RuvC